MDEQPPRAPELDRSTVEGLVECLDGMASWLSADHAAARSRGHDVSGRTLENLRLYEEAALLFREECNLFD